MHKCLLICSFLFYSIQICCQNKRTFLRTLTEESHIGEFYEIDELLKKHEFDIHKHTIILNQFKISKDKKVYINDVNSNKEIDSESFFLNQLQKSKIHLKNRDCSKAIIELEKLKVSNIDWGVFEKAEINRILGHIYAEWNQYYKSLKHYSLAQKQFNSVNSKSGVVLVDYALLSLYLNFHRWDLFKLKLPASIKENGEFLAEHALIRANYNILEASNHFIEGNIDSALIETKRNIPIYIANLDSANVMKTYFNVAVIYSRIDDMESSYANLLNYKKFEVELTDKRQYIRVLTSLLGVFSNKSYQKKCLKLFEYQSINEYFQKLLYEIDEVNDQDLKLNFLQQSTIYYQKQGDKDLIIEALEKENDFWFEIQTKDTSSLEMVRYELQKEITKNIRLKLEEKNAKNEGQILRLQLDNRKRNAAIGIFLSFVVLISLVIIRRKKTKVKEENHKMEIGRLEKNNLELELSKTKHALMEFKKNTLEKTSFFEKMSLENERIVSENRMFKDETLKMKILTDSDWLKFKGLFESVFPNFNVVLRKSNLELTQGEKRMLMLKKMDFHNLEISRILGIGQESVRKSIYRLKNKIEPLLLSELIEKF